ATVLWSAGAWNCIQLDQRPCCDQAGVREEQCQRGFGAGAAGFRERGDDNVEFLAEYTAEGTACCSVIYDAGRDSFCVLLPVCELSSPSRRAYSALQRHHGREDRDGSPGRRTSPQQESRLP